MSKETTQVKTSKSSRFGTITYTVHGPIKWDEEGVATMEKESALELQAGDDSIQFLDALIAATTTTTTADPNIITTTTTLDPEAEKAAIMTELMKSTVPQLQKMAEDNKLPKEEWGMLNKPQLAVYLAAH
jgi:hypothetical protein